MKNKHEKIKQLLGKQTKTLYLVPKSVMLSGHIRLPSPHGARKETNVLAY